MPISLLKTALSSKLRTELTNLIKIRSLSKSMEAINVNTASRWQMAVKDLDPKQVEFYHNEHLIMVDDNDSVLGPITKGESHSIETVRKSVYHRALSLLIFDEQNRFLLTQRAASKITFPNYFTNACCSHPLYNEVELEDDGNAIGVKRATIRRSKFELGVDDLKLDELKFVNRLAYRAESDGGLWGEAEVDYIFVVRKNVDLKLNPDEVQSYRYVTKSQMQELLLNHRERDIKITPWVRLLARDFLFKYWDHLHDLDSIAQSKTIVNYRDLFPAS